MIKKIIKKIYFYILKKKKKLSLHSDEISIKIKLGVNVEIAKNTFIDQNCDIGSYTYIGKNCNITKSTIGRYCSIANNVSIGQGEHDLTKISTSSLFYNEGYDELTKESCIVGNDVWVGTDVVILRGVSIGDGAVIGANSVVTKDIPPFAIVAGSPAKLIRYRFNEEKINEIIESKWWSEELRGARAIIEELEK
ncbi:CatB-related O-acetyltransferase [Arcobacter sp. CECT 8985]|uniref:CatB-related O-acetyltransferase n=1 Tax=Arcobacter sp. CECT 8985 TaxID=1935424 RepID=UPI00100A2DB1|nr:CatB-related O-acetyltransferase [Arcobacter sp. CECT 8985]RXJ84871.1 chloramphenicol acetyltransferase [Arcobacter sp. CECT 8985]